MSLRRHINEIIKEFLGREKIYSQPCRVLSVDVSTRTCQLEPINGDAERKGRIQADLSLIEGIYIKPAVDSKVILTFINNLTGVITNYSEIDSIEIKISDKQLNIDSTEVSFNGGAIGGMVRGDNLKTESEKDKSIIDAILSIINGSQIPEPGSGSPSALQAALKTALTGLSSGVWTNLENTDIKQ